MKNGRLRYSYDSVEQEDGPAMILNVSRERASNFLKNLENLNLYRWKEQYFGEKKEKRREISALSSRWYLLYKEVDKEAREFQGLNDFPKEWESLMSLIADLTVDMDCLRFNELSAFSLDVRDCREQILWNPLSKEENSVEVEYQEFLQISRTNKKLIYQQYINNIFTVKHEYNIPNIVDYLLGNIERYFSTFSEKEQADAGEASSKVIISLYFQNGTKRVLRRTYDRYGLPDDWDDFLDDFRKTLAYHGVFGILFDSGLYHHGVKEEEYIYLSCIFEPNGKTYYYRSKEDNLSIGDFVLVPSTKQENAETVVMISEIMYCKKEDVPYPLEKTKFIVRKIDDGGFYNFLSQNNPDEEA
jgi:hypothetical protein